MRITNRMMANNMLATISKNRELAADLQLDIATTKKVRRPSDDPAGVMQLQRLRGLVGRNNQFVKNITQMRDFMNNSTAAIDAAIEHVQDAKDIAIQASSGTVSVEARASLATQVGQLIGLVSDLGNTKFKGRYLFGGTLTTGTAPFTRAGDVITYNGNTKDIEGKIGYQTKMTYNKNGQELFDPTGGPDIFGELAALKQGLEANDEDAIQQTVSTLNSGLQHLISVTSEFGILQERLTSTEEIVENENVNFADTISKIQDTDVVKAIVDSQVLENAINSGLKTMANIVQASLVDFVS